MNVKLSYSFLLLLLSSSAYQVAAQDSIAFKKDKINVKKDKINVNASKYSDELVSKIEKYDKRINAKTEQTLVRLTNWEAKVKTLLYKVNPQAGDRLFQSGMTFADALAEYRKGYAVATGFVENYNRYRDNVNTKLNFLDSAINGGDTGCRTKLTEAKKKFSELEGNLKKSESLEHFIKERKHQLLLECVQYIGNSKYLQKIDKDVYYYSETLRNYKELFQDSKKAEEVMVKILQKLPAFQEFVSKNSRLAALFQIPGSSSQTIGGNIAGLQTRSQVNDLILQQIAAGGPNASGVFQNNLQEAKSKLSDLQNKLQLTGNSSANSADMPSFKPNTQRSKTFSQRIEYSVDIQSQRANYYFPATTSFGFMVGYKLNDKSIAGLGTNYKLGLGSGWNNIRFSHQGLGIRSFIDYKLKRNFYFSGGFEMNNNVMFTDLPGLIKSNAWQKSGLAGISKQLGIQSKFLKKTKVSLLWDFLSYYQIPRTQPIVFRMGYAF